MHEFTFFRIVLSFVSMRSLILTQLNHTRCHWGDDKILAVMRLHEVIWPNRYLLTLFGLWPMRSDAGLARRLFAHLRFIVEVLIIVSLIVPEVMTVVIYWGDIDILGNFGSLTVIDSLATLKLLYYMWRRRSFRSVYQHVKDFWEISDDPEERRHYERPAQVMKLLSIVSYVAAMNDLLSFEAVALIGCMRSRREIDDSLRHRPLLLELFYGFDTQRTPTYELVFAWQSVCCFCAINAVVGCDCTMMAFIVHVSAQFKLIAARFRAIGRKIGEQKIIAKDDREIRAEIGKCVSQHQHTIEVAEELNVLLSPMLFCQIMSSGLQICLGGYAVIEGDGGRGDVAKYVMLFVTLLMQLIAWCASAEFLIRESTAVAETIYYEVPWFRLTPSLRRDLNFVMMRAQKGCYVSALYQIMSVRRITEVFNAAGSYMALLKSMKK